LCMRGQGIRKDELIRGATILDIAPSVLTMLGLPIGEDMDGKPLLDAFEDIPVVDHIASWEPTPQGGALVSSAGARGLADQFVEFGMFDVAAQSPHPAERTAAENLLFNQVRVYMSTGRPLSALPIIQRLFDSAPEDVRYQCVLAQCYVASGRLDDAEQLLAAFLAGHEKYPWMHFLMGVIHMHRKQTELALDDFRKAEETGERSAAIHSFIGNVYLTKRLWSHAEQSFAKALALNADYAAAHTGMSAVRLRQRREDEAADHALQAISLRYEQPAAHFQLGVAMARMGQDERAVTALEATLALAPELTRARRYLAQVRARMSPILTQMRHGR
jgi:tetratricopeptide (TPR) repeat protein